MRWRKDRPRFNFYDLRLFSLGAGTRLETYQDRPMAATVYEAIRGSRRCRFAVTDYLMVTAQFPEMVLATAAQEALDAVEYVPMLVEAGAGL